ncbi:hypothetical protein AB0J82_36690 [Asanoa sp. NPDC049518]|uniref:hypothetical protein n=1 Tax=unclassified Asanoa TaxID=2685164 RepID=UPI00343B15B4
MTKKHNRNPATKPTPTGTPAVTVHAVTVCVPDEVPSPALTSRQLDRHFSVRGQIVPRFWARSGIRWQRRQLLAPRPGAPTCCAGGPVKLLDLDGLRRAAMVGAAIRHQQWSTVVHDTKPATPWPVMRQRHVEDPDRFPMDAVVRVFYNQPRVNAIRMHNAVTHGAGRLALGELEMFQAGRFTYEYYAASAAVAGDMIVTVDGDRIGPDGDLLAQRITYFEHANRYLDGLDEDLRLLAVAV